MVVQIYLLKEEVFFYMIKLKMMKSKSQYFQGILIKILRNCSFVGTAFSNSVIVNTKPPDCLSIDKCSGVLLYSTYPKCDMTIELNTALETLRDNRNLKKNKLLFISDTKYNQLNLFLLQGRYHNRLPALLLELNHHSTAKITTYKKMECELNKLLKLAIM